MSKMSSGKGHAVFEAYEDLHKPGCLSRHQDWERGNTCSHRWQASEKANSESRYGSALTHLVQDFPNKKTEFLRVGKLQISSVLGVPALVPFGTCWWPWANQAHHIVPNAILRDTVMDFSKDVEGMQDLIFKGLLSEEYNINDKVNMIVLPTKGKDGRAIGLPIHPNNHESYSANMRGLVDASVDAIYSPVIPDMEKLAKEHEIPEAENLKADLETHSKVLYESIWAYGATIKEESAASVALNDMPMALFGA